MKSTIKILLPLGLYFIILAINHPALDKKVPEVVNQKTTPYLIVQR
jgi:hypothetical protein